MSRLAMVILRKDTKKLDGELNASNAHPEEPSGIATGKQRGQEDWEAIIAKSRASKQNGYFAAVSRKRNDVYKTPRGKKRK